MWTADHWKDYEVIDTCGGEKLERWGQYILVRPDPQVIWNTPKTANRFGTVIGENLERIFAEWKISLPFDIPELFAR